MINFQRFGLFAVAFLAQVTLRGAPPARTEASAITPRDAVWHAKWHDRIDAAMKVGKYDFDFVLIGDSIMDS